MAIEIRNERGEIAELYPGAALNVERHNQLFNDDGKLFEDITYPFNLPPTENNKLFLGNGHLVDSENKVYELAVQCAVGGDNFFSGLLSYSFANGDYDALLLVNYGSLKTKVKRVKINEIFVDDSFPITFELMYSSCANPQNYHFAFFPIHNNFIYNRTGESIGYYYFNKWDHAAQSFYETDIGTAKTPYFKLSYVIKKICKYLGFDAQGNFFDTAMSENIYIYNLQFCIDRVPPSDLMLPNMSIDEFFATIRTRFRICVSFNALAKIASVVSTDFLLSTNDVEDLTAYVSKIESIETNSVDGFEILLKPDTTDKLFLDPENPDTYIATNKLTVGAAEKTIEINASTLKSKNIGPGKDLPATYQNALNNPPYNFLRFLKFTGFKTLPDLTLWPGAEPLELSAADSYWYDLLYQGKLITFYAYLPTDVLSRLEINKVFQSISNEGDRFNCLPKVIEYTLTDDSDLIHVKISAILLKYVVNSGVVSPITQELTKSETQYYFVKALFGEKIEPPTVTLVYLAGFVVKLTETTHRTLTVNEEYSTTLQHSTDNQRVGGTTGYLHKYKLVNWTQPDFIEIRCDVQPQYMYFDATLITFTYHPSGYWFAKPLLKSVVGIIQWQDIKNIWVVF